ncbi:hypothetical protein SNE40_013213 [Patella caerulea]|uniref:Uncharacterized protein n=1 Tax=Patella caerulea TaxID=87958 RepID=A0AAN8PTC1_PATCE
MSQDQRPSRKKTAPAKFADLVSIEENASDPGQQICGSDLVNNIVERGKDPTAAAGREQHEQGRRDEFIRFLQSKSIKPDTIQSLCEIGFDCLEALALLQEEDLSETAINKGQARLVYKPGLGPSPLV